MAEYLKEDFMEQQLKKEGELFPDLAKKPKENKGFLLLKSFRKQLEEKAEHKKAASKPERAEPLKE